MHVIYTLKNKCGWLFDVGAVVEGFSDPGEKAEDHDKE